MHEPLKVAGEFLMKLFEVFPPEVFLTIFVVIAASFVICHEKVSILVRFLIAYACFAGMLILLGSLIPTVIQWIIIAYVAFCLFKYATAK